MSGRESYDDNANADEGSLPNPGAPTPLSALEVSLARPECVSCLRQLVADLVGTRRGWVGSQNATSS